MRKIVDNVHTDIGKLYLKVYIEKAGLKRYAEDNLIKKIIPQYLLTFCSANRSRVSL